MAEEVSGSTTIAYHFHYDGNGNVTEITDSTGSQAASYRYRYDVFGNALVAAGPYAQQNRYRFSTKPQDAEVAKAPLYYYGYRYYDPATGRWPSRDPIEERGGVNLYGFVGNEGVNWVDYLGLEIPLPQGMTRSGGNTLPPGLFRQKCKISLEQNHAGDHTPPDDLDGNCFRYGAIGCFTETDELNARLNARGVGVGVPPNGGSFVGPRNPRTPGSEGDNGGRGAGHQPFIDYMNETLAAAREAAIEMLSCCVKVEITITCPAGEEVTRKAIGNLHY